MKHKLPWLYDKTTHLIRVLQNAFKTQSPEACSAACQEIETHLPSSLFSTIDKFKATGREQSATFHYWLSFLEAGDTLLKLLRADRKADFKLHLVAILEVTRHSSSLQVAIIMHDTHQSTLQKCISCRQQPPKCLSTCPEVGSS